MRNWGLQVQLHQIQDGVHELFTTEVLEKLDHFIMEEAPGPARALTRIVTDLTQFFDSLAAN